MRPASDLSLYLVTDTTLCGEVGVAATVAAAVGAGVGVVQLRDPDADDDTLVALGRELVATLRGTGVPLIVNDAVHLVAPIGAAGAHVGQGDLDVALARRALGPDALLGLSVQTVAHVEDALPHGDALDYLGVGPVYPQTTKPDAAAPGGLAVLRDIVTASPWPCVAIGGITPGRVAPVRQAGAAGVAVVSAICGQADIASATRRLRTEWDLAGQEDDR